MVKLCIFLSSLLDNYYNFCSVYACPLGFVQAILHLCMDFKICHSCCPREEPFETFSGMLKVKVTLDKNDKMVIN